MIISGLIKQSLIDYPGEVAAVIFTGGCNLRCPFCHNPALIHKPKDGSMDIEQIIKFLEERKGFLDGVVITGGEPTLHRDLFDFIGRIKSSGYKIKLDTNGSNSELVKQLLDRQMIDCIAMDIKAPLEFKRYLSACGKITRKEFLDIKNSVIFLKNSTIEVIFRTTIVPELHSQEDIIEIARSIEGNSVYYIQQYNPENVYNTAFKYISPYTIERLYEIAESCKPYVRKVKVINL